MSDSLIRNFYDLGGGISLVNPKNYTARIKEFLEYERILISKIFLNNGFDLLFEVGCMDGRLLDLAVGLRVNYQGIDLVNRLIKHGKEKSL